MCTIIVDDCDEQLASLPSATLIRYSVLVIIADLVSGYLCDGGCWVAFVAMVAGRVACECKKPAQYH